MPKLNLKLVLAIAAVTFGGACTSDFATAPVHRTDGLTVRATHMVGMWESRAPIPLGRHSISAAEVGGRIYTFGGSAFTNVCHRVTNAEMYDPATDTWQSRAPMPEAREGAHTVAVNGIVYVIGGSRGCGEHFGTVFAFDPASNLWSVRASAPAPISSGASTSTTAINDIIYIAGGKANEHEGANDHLYAYNPATNSWSQKAPMPTKRGGHVTVGAGGKLYVIGGNAQPNRPDDGRTVFAYDPVTNAWSTRAASPIHVSGAAAAVVHDRIHVVGGGLDARAHASYDPASDTWAVQSPLPTGQAGAGVATVNGTFYVISGWSPGNIIPRDVRAFTPVPPPPPNTAPSANAGGDQELFRTSFAGVSVTLDGSSSTDVDGTITGYIWSENGTTLGSGATLMRTFDRGTHVVKLAVTDDDGASAEDFVTIIVRNNPPNAFAGLDQILECVRGSAVASLAGSATDIDGEIAGYEWLGVGTGAGVSTVAQSGQTTFTLRVTDNDGATDEDDVVVNVVDTRAPHVTLTTPTTRIWPPNHRMVLVAQGVSAADDCDGGLPVAVTVTSNEPVNGPGDGDTSPDWNVVPIASGFDVYVRAERSGRGSGRAYTISASAIDKAGHLTTRTATVSVPHSR